MANQLQAQEDTIRIPVYGESKYTMFTYLGQQFINCFPEVIKDTTTGEGSVRLTKRPGVTDTLDIFTTTGAASRGALACIANMVVTQLSDVNVAAIADLVAAKIYIVQYRPSAGTSTLIGTITGASATEYDYIHIQEAQIANAGTIYAGITVTWTLANRSASKCYYARSDGTKFTATTLTQITAAAFPDQLGTAKVVTGPMIQMNGIFYVLTTDGTIYSSGSTAGTPNDPTLWNALSTILTYQYPDGGIGLYRYKHHLIAVGTDSIEFFNDIGNPPPASPLERTEQAFIKFGAIHSMAVTNLDDNLYWISYSSSSTVGLWKLDGYTPTKLSNAKEDFLITRVLTGSAIQTAVKLYPLFVANKKHLLLTGVLNSYTMPFAITSDHWGNSTDTYYTYGQDTFNAVATNMLYSLEDKVFWGANFYNSGLSSGAPIPSVAYPGSSSTSALNFYRQYILFSDINNGQMNADRVFYMNTNSYVDLNPSNPSGFGTSMPVTAIVQFNTVEFENQKRKTIHKVNLIFDEVPHSGTSDTGVYSTSLFYAKDGHVSAAVRASNAAKERVITYPNDAYRYYYNNLGAMRRADFCVVSTNKDPFYLKALELKVSQGVH